MTKDNATPRPWEIQEPYYNESLLVWACFIHCITETLKPCLATGNTKEECLFNARLIVKAVNEYDENQQRIADLIIETAQYQKMMRCHDELVEALSYMLNQCDPWDLRAKKAKQALAKAGEK